MQMEKKIRAERSGLPRLAALMAAPLMAERSIVLAGRRARLRLETEVWNGLDEVARRQGRPVADLCGELDDARDDGVPLSSAIRTFVLDYFREASRA